MNSERRFILAVLLCVVIWAMTPLWLKMVTPKIPTAAPQQTSEQKTAAETKKIEAVERAAESPAHLEPAMPETVREENRYQFSNQVYHAEFSDLGASIRKLVLTNYRKFKDDQIVLIDTDQETSGAFTISIPNQGINLEHIIFSLEKLDEAKGIVAFRATVANTWEVEKTYVFAKDQPHFMLKVHVRNLSSEMKKTVLELESEMTLREHGGRAEMFAHAYAATMEKLEDASLGKLAKKPHVTEGSVQWSALTRKYFAVIVDPASAAQISQSMAPGKHADHMYNRLSMEPVVLSPQGATDFDFFVFAGPQYYDLLKSYNADYQKILFQGFFGIFKTWLLAALEWTHKLVKNYGWAIIIITVFIKLLFSPLTHISFESMRKMQAIQPKMKALQERYKEDRAKLSQEMMELYRKHKVNPMAGCLPMLLQIPIFIAFYHVLSQTVEFKGEPFIWWITDLSEPDRLFMLPFSIPFIGNAINLLPLLMIGSMIWQQRLTPQTAPPDQQKILMFMPVFFGFIFYKLPSGLVLYWFVNNLLSIFHQLFIKGKALPHHSDDE